MSSQALIHYEQGKRFYQQKQFDDAISQFSEAIRQGADNVQVLARCYNARGVVYFYLGEFKKVIKDCSEGLKLDPRNANYHNCRGNAYFSLGRFGKACEDFSAAIDLSPKATHGRYFNNRGSAYRRLKMFREAIDDYTKAISLDPKNGNYYNNRGNTYFDMGDFQAAIDDFEKALGLEPYSPKTKLTLEQAKAALDQEKRMKNSSEFTGVYSSLKKKGKTMRRKEREAKIFVSPKGVEIQFERGFRKRKDQHSYAWSEAMKIELLDDEHVKVILDEGRSAWVTIFPCDAPAVEEELIGRITTKFASYSTACLVAQHEGVCNEYADLLSHINEAKSKRTFLEELLRDAIAQKKQIPADSPEYKQAGAAVTNLEAQIASKTRYIDSETERAESVRVKAEQEARPVLDMVLIMQNRVRELYQSRVKNSKDKYKVEDLVLSEQCDKMEQLVRRTHELSALVSKKVLDLEDAFGRMKKGADSESDEEGEEEAEEAEEGAAETTETTTNTTAAAPPTKAPTPKAASPQAAAAPPADSGPKNLDELKEDSGEESDWDDIDGDALPNAFAATAGEVFFAMETSGGMTTITPHRGGATTGQMLSSEEVVMLKKEELANMTEEQKKAQQQLEEMERKAAEAEAKLSDKEKALQSLQRTNEALQNIRAESSTVQEKLAAKMQAIEQDRESLEKKVEMTENEKRMLRESMKKQQDEVLALRSHLDAVNEALQAKAAESDEKTKEFEQMANKGAELEALIVKMKAEASEDNRKVEEMKAKYDAQVREMEAQSEELRANLELVAHEKEQFQSELQKTNLSMAELRKHLKEMQNQLQSANEEKLEKERRLREAEEKTKQNEAVVEKLKEQSRQEEIKRRQLHNLIQEIKGNIRVYVRIRPVLKGMGQNQYELFEEIIGSDGRGLQLNGPEEKSATGGKSGSKKWKFEFDRVFNADSRQEQVFEEISQLVQSALDGYKVSIFAYGQTGSGKTYTMQGPDLANHDTRGMIPRSVEQIFSHMEAIKDRGWTYECNVSFCEIYNTHVRDLLTGSMDDLEIRMVKDGKKTRTEVEGLTTVTVASPADVQPLMERADASRTSAATASNERSSRSHSVFTMRITGTHTESGTQSEGRLNLIDLAGSERINKSMVQGKELEEAKAINSSLTTLGDVIAALANNAKHVPFRNSKLTYMLQDSFGGGSKTLMFINCSGETEHQPETLCSLRFGAKVHDCHIGQGKKQIKAGKKK